MISVWGTPIVANVDQVVADLRLERFDEGLLRDINSTGSDLMCTCPFHKGGKEKKPSCGVLLRDKITDSRKYEAGTVHCYTCGYTADLPQFVADFLGLSSPVQGFKWLVARYNYSSAEREPLELNLYRGQAQSSSYMDEAEVERFYIELLANTPALEYLKRRALSFEIVKMYKLGFDPEDGVVLFPVRDMSGKVAFYKGRSIVGKHFYNAKDIDKTSQVFGLWELLHSEVTPEDEIWITESEIDALTLVSQGKYAVAIMGSHISDAQCKALESTPFRRFVLATDNDEAGRKGAAQIKRLLIPKGFRFTNLSWDTELKDINDLVKQFGDAWESYLTGF